MRWLRYLADDGEATLGVLDDDTVRGAEPGTTMLDLLRRGDLQESGRRLVQDSGRTVPLAGLRLLAPIADPPSVRDFMAFEQHVEGMGMLAGATPLVPDVWYRQPLFYFSNPGSIIGPDDDVAMPPGCTVFDFELEVAVVVGALPDGRDLTDLSLEEAADAIAGYVLMNDWSARDLQAVEMQGPLGPCKGKDSATTLGPYLVGAEELPGLAHGETDVVLSAEVSGRPFGTAPLSSMGWSFAELVAYASRGTRLRPGDVLGSGTCGDGCLAERWGREGRGSWPPLSPGDQVVLDGGVLGAMHSTVVPGQAVRAPLLPRTGRVTSR